VPADQTCSGGASTTPMHLGEHAREHITMRATLGADTTTSRTQGRIVEGRAPVPGSPYRQVGSKHPFTRLYKLHFRRIVTSFEKAHVSQEWSIKRTRTW
jgi:hypothetical protein